MFCFQIFSIRPGKPARVFLPAGYRLATMGETPEGGVVVAFTKPDDLAATPVICPKAPTTPVKPPTTPQPESCPQDSAPAALLNDFYGSLKWPVKSFLA
ncbi:hypothetical protein E2C01_095264 [Portunus trituberculatus]|uniref:Uncharacterized protein n=1 Tax=Portunus trituberculatus TaxID=210409 RepID=A0A5B7K5C0_PORTR|nr:hypothetical protein [Portunus trituberculatus]